MRCIIIDDDKMSRVSLTKLCEKVSHLDVVKVYESALEAVGDLKSIEQVDLIFLDIHMPELGGFDFVKAMKSVPKIIFTTSDPSKALEAFEVEAVDYLLKPITLPRFLSAVERIRDQSITQASISTISTETKHIYKDEIFVNTDRRLVRISVDEICIVEAKGDYILVKMEDQKVHIVRSRFKNMEERLSPDKFIKVHRSYIINVSKIVDIEDSSVLVKNEIVPISRSHRSQVIEKLNLL